MAWLCVVGTQLALPIRTGGMAVLISGHNWVTDWSAATNNNWATLQVCGGELFLQKILLAGCLADQEGNPELDG